MQAISRNPVGFRVQGLGVYTLATRIRQTRSVCSGYDYYYVLLLLLPLLLLLLLLLPLLLLLLLLLTTTNTTTTTTCYYFALAKKPQPVCLQRANDAKQLYNPVHPSAEPIAQKVLGRPCI